MIKNNFAEADGGNPHASSCLSMQPCKSHPVYNGSVNDLFSLHCRVESYLMINTYKFKSVYNHLQLSEDLHTSRSPPPLFPLQGVKTPNMNEAGGKKCSSASRGFIYSSLQALWELKYSSSGCQLNSYPQKEGETCVLSCWCNDSGCWRTRPLPQRII